MEWKAPILRAGRRYGAPLLLAATAAVLFLVPGARAALEYDRTAVAAGEVWRLATCHLVHASLEHLLWDVGAVLALGLVVASRGPKLFLLVAGGSGIVIPLAVHFALPGLATYCGLSGIASALFAAFAVTLLAEAFRERRWGLVGATSLLAVAFVAKVVFEASTGTAVFVPLATAALVPVPLAHLLGAAAGSAGGLAAAYGTKGA